MFTPITSIFSTPIGIAGFNDNFKPFLENKGGNVVKATIGTDYINDIEQVSQLALIDLRKERIVYDPRLRSPTSKLKI